MVYQKIPATLEKFSWHQKNSHSNKKIITALESFRNDKKQAFFLQEKNKKQ